MPIDSALTRYAYFRPYVQPMFYVSNDAGSTVASGSKATFNKAITNISSVWDDTNNRFTTPTTGYYEFNIDLLSASADGTAFSFIIKKNGTQMTNGTYPRGYTVKQYTSATASGIISLAAGDYIELWISSGTMHTTYCNFSGKRVG